MIRLFVFDLQRFAYTDRDDSNYMGELFLIGTSAQKTPFLSMIGGLTGGGKSTKSFQFPLAQPYALQAASQDTQSEATSAAAGTPVTTVRGQDYNVVQIMKKDVEVSKAKQSTTGEFGGIQVIGDQPVTDELSFQKGVQLLQLAVDVEYSFLNGAFVDVGTSATNQTTRGIISATTTNTVAAGGADLSKALVDSLLVEMATQGSVFINPVVFCGAFQKQMFSDIYGFAPTDRNVGGLNIKQVETDFASLGIVYAPEMPAATLLIADLAVCSPMFCMHEGNAVSFTPTAIVAAKEGGFFYTQIGLDYGPEEYHGTITGLSTS